MPGRNWIQGRVAISTLIERVSSSWSPGSGNWRTTWSCFSSLSTSLTVSFAPARFLAMRRASPMGRPKSGGAMEGNRSASAMLPPVQDLDADQLRKLVVGELEHLHPQPPSLVDDGEVGDAVDAVHPFDHGIQVGLPHRAAERPAFALRTALQGMQALLHFLLHVALDSIA